MLSLENINDLLYYLNYSFQQFTEYRQEEINDTGNINIQAIPSLFPMDCSIQVKVSFF